MVYYIETQLKECSLESQDCTAFRQMVMVHTMGKVWVSGTPLDQAQKRYIHITLADLRCLGIVLNIYVIYTLDFFMYYIAFLYIIPLYIGEQDSELFMQIPSEKDVSAKDFDRMPGDL